MSTYRLGDPHSHIYDYIAASLGRRPRGSLLSKFNASLASQQHCCDSATVCNLQVRSSSEAAKRSFLEKKGLTAAEIDEAFRRVPPEAPAPAPAGTSTTSTPAVGANNLVTYTQQAAAPQQQPPGQPVTPAVPSQALVPVQPHLPPVVHPQPVRWTQVNKGDGVHHMAEYQQAALDQQVHMQQDMLLIAAGTGSL